MRNRPAPAIGGAGLSIPPAAADAREGSASCVEDDHRPYTAAGAHEVESVVDAPERQALRNHGIKPQLAFQIQPGQPWEVAARPGTAIAGSHNALVAHERTETQTDLLVGV